MTALADNLVLGRCPHCSIADPNLRRQHHLQTASHDGRLLRQWSVYCCLSCGGVVTASALQTNRELLEYFPQSPSVDAEIPERPRAFLLQAQSTLHAPAGSVMLSASAVDAMLKMRGYTDGSLYARIEQSAADHILTKDMAEWAHAVRLDANDQRHADESAELPTQSQAKRVLEFAFALAQYLFVLPKRIERGLDAESS